MPKYCVVSLLGRVVMVCMGAYLHTSTLERHTHFFLACIQNIKVYFICLVNHEICMKLFRRRSKHRIQRKFIHKSRPSNRISHQQSIVVQCVQHSEIGRYVKVALIMRMCLEETRVKMSQSISTDAVYCRLAPYCRLALAQVPSATLALHTHLVEPYGLMHTIKVRSS